MSKADTFQAARKGWMSTLAKAKPNQLATLMPDLPELHHLRPPEVGAVMVQGRIGATGARFNLGEMSVTRCSVQLPNGTIGHGYVQGRDKRHAERAAAIDALMQTEQAAQVKATVLDVLDATFATERQARAEKAAATKVDFFTMVRGEDA